MNQTSVNLNLAYTLFCEDVRFEASQHLSLMGVLHQIVVPQLPVGLIRFCVVNHWTGEGQYLSEVRILSPDRKQAVAVSQPSGFAVPPDGYSDNVTVFVNLNLTQPGRYIVQTLINSNVFSEMILPVLYAQQQQPVAESEQVH